ncbi:MAG: 50S ribosomal protein L16 [DPANN group archaeon]|nr:50S ribosomal protein L16 [DPANN group archaeon]
MGLRPASVDRDYKGRPYTRTAKRVHKKNYIKGIPGSKINKFDTGKLNDEYDIEFLVYPDRDMQIRHNALEACRVSANGYLRKNITTQDFRLKIRVHPHNILRAHAQAAVAQADRFYDGMRKPFGKPAGRAARVKQKQAIFSVRSFKKYSNIVKEACKRASMKIPYSTKLVVTPLNKKVVDTPIKEKVVETTTVVDATVEENVKE